MPEPSTVVLVAFSAALVVMVVTALIAALRHRDPVGRAVAGHANLVGALRDTAIRSTNAPPRFADRSQADHGVNIVRDRKKSSRTEEVVAEGRSGDNSSGGQDAMVLHRHDEKISIGEPSETGRRCPPFRRGLLSLRKEEP